MAEEKTEQVTVGRAVEVDNTFYGPGTYKVTPSVAKKLRAKKATANAADTMRAERERRAAEGADEGGGPEKTGVIIGGGSKTGEGEGGGSASGGAGASSSQTADDSSQAAGPGGKKVAVAALEGLTGELPEDFPKRAELAKGAPEADPPIPPVTRYEELTKLTREQLDAIPGIGEASVDAIGQRLFADAEKAGGGSK